MKNGMLSLRRLALTAMALAGVAAAQPALTTIQDTLYRADGTRYNGTVYIEWHSFEAGDQTNVATSNLTLNVINGALRVRLVPTTTASAGANYNVTYSSRGMNTFTEIWAVPPSNVTLRIRDVRVSTGTIVGPPPVTSDSIQIPDIPGLQNELAVRPMRGIGYGIGRAAMINSAGQIDAVVGSLGDCVHVDGSSGPCGSGGGSGFAGFSDAEVPAGLVNGSNAVFTLSASPSPVSSLGVFRNGLLQTQGADYTVSGNAITFFTASLPQAGDILQATYRFGSSNTTVPQVVCSTTGISTNSASSTSLGTCTIPAGLLHSGDHIEIQAQFGHTGTAVGFTSEVRVGTSSVLLRSAAAGESFLSGRASFNVVSSNQTFDGQSWGPNTAFAANAGQSSQNAAQAITVDFRGNVASGTTDNVTLNNFVVVHYPAQVNP
jgi:hypothetical protein